VDSAKELTPLTYQQVREALVLYTASGHSTTVAEFTALYVSHCPCHNKARKF